MQRSQAQCFGATRGEIEVRADVNHCRSLPLVRERLANAAYPAVPLGSKLTLIQYGSSTLASTEPIGVPILRMNNLQQDGWALDDLKYVTLPEKEVESYRLEPGDILFNRTNSKELVGKCEVFREPGKWVFASYLIRVRTNPLELDPQFASDFLNAPTGRLQIDCVSRQIVGMTNINSEEIRDFGIPLPPLAIQRELVAAMDAARALRRQRLADADELLADFDNYLTTALGITLPDAVVKPVFAIRQSDLGKRVDSYSTQPRFRELFARMRATGLELKTLGQLTNTIFSGTTPTAGGVAYVVPPDGVRFVRSGEITKDGGVTATSPVHLAEAVHLGPMKRSQVLPGDLLIAIVGATIGSVGLYDQEEPANINQAVAGVRLPGSNTFRQYVRYYLQSALGQQLLDYFKRPVARANINLQEVSEIPILIPTEGVQQAIVDEVQRRRAAARALREAAETGWATAKANFEKSLLTSA